jgi:hypothetical protein
MDLHHLLLAGLPAHSGLRPTPDIPLHRNNCSSEVRRLGATPPVKDSLGISASLEFSQGRANDMTEPDNLSRKIGELKEWQTVAWRRIAEPLITQFERREIRNHMKECDAELRRCLQMMSERIRFRTRSVEDVGDSFAKPSFRLLAQ